MGEASRILGREISGQLHRHRPVRSFVVQDLYPSGKTEEVQQAFDLMEYLLKNGNHGVRELVQIGFLEDLQNLASRQAFGKEAFVPFLGPRSREAWDELEKFSAGEK